MIWSAYLMETRRLSENETIWGSRVRQRVEEDINFAWDGGNWYFLEPQDSCFSCFYFFILYLVTWLTKFCDSQFKSYLLSGG